MKLAVVTHTNRAWARDLSQVTKSVNSALPENSCYEIIELDDGFDNFIEARHAAMALGDIVVFVDDDDYISADSLHLVKQAIEKTNVGVAYTREVIIRADGVHSVVTPTLNYGMIHIHPQIIHHMSAINTQFVTKRSYDTSTQYQCGIEWTMKTDAIGHAGAIHVPVDGYYWIQHKNQNHKIPSVQVAYTTGMRNMRQTIGSWIKQTGVIPTYQL